MFGLIWLEMVRWIFQKTVLARLPRQMIDIDLSYVADIGRRHCIHWARAFPQVSDTTS